MRTIRFVCITGLALVASAIYAGLPIGLVLSGGGAKGAYEVGVWQEMQAVGLASNVVAISGTSIGAINAAIFSTYPDKAEKLWFENSKDMFVLNKDRIAEIGIEALDAVREAGKDAESTGKVIRVIGAVSRKIISHVLNQYGLNAQSEGLIDSARLVEALGANLPAIWAKDSPKVYVTATEVKPQFPFLGVKVWCINDEPQERKVLMLRASSAVPEAFGSIRIDGSVYVDGFLKDNTPIQPILENHPEIKTIIVVFLKDEKHLKGKLRNHIRDLAEKADVRLIEIIPSETIGGLFGVQAANVSTEKVKELIVLGRKDARKVLQEFGVIKAISSDQ